MKHKWDLGEVISRLIEFRKERKWEQFHTPRNVATALTIESTELLEHFLWQNNDNVKQIQDDAVRYQGIHEEIADIAIYLIYLSNDLDIDLVSVIEDKIEKNAIKYPKDEFKGRLKEDNMF